MPTAPDELRSARLILRRWAQRDRSAFAEMNADPVVMQYFRSTLTASESDAFVQRIEDHFEAEGFDAHFTPAVEVGRVGLDEIVSFTAATNQRSQRVMEKLGMRRDIADDFDHPAVAAPSPLRPHVLYRLAASDWALENPD